MRWARSGLRAGVERSPRLRRAAETARHELGQALEGGRYGEAYYASGDASQRGTESGYGVYSRATSNADAAAYLLWRHLAPRTALDAGCAQGFVVEALREVGVDACGCDVSGWAVGHPAAGAAGHVRVADLARRLPYADGAFDVVAVLETLEHLPPEQVPKAVAQLARITRAWVMATIPSFGPNANGPGGWLNTKARNERVDELLALGPDYRGPLAYDDLYRDADGEPIEGHLTIASFAWWTEQFAAAGLERCAAMEARIHPDLARFGLTKYWNLYVLRVPGTPLPPEMPHDKAAVTALEARWGLDQRRAAEDDLATLRETLGDAAVRRAVGPNG